MVLKASDSGKEFEKAPAGTHIARCFQVIDLGTQFDERYGSKHKVFIAWELPDTKMTSEDKPFSISRFYTVSLHEKSNLRKDLVSWRGRDFTTEEKAGFEIGKLLGVPCLINVIHNESNGKVYANVGAVMQPQADMTCPPAINDPVFFDLSEFDAEVFNGLSERMQALVSKSEEYEFLIKPDGASVACDDNTDVPF